MTEISKLPELSSFSLVGGTSLSLQLGHRRSDDLDFFTDGTFDISELKEALLRFNPGIVFMNETRQDISFSLPLSDDESDMRELDIYNWAVNFIRPVLVEENIRLASLEDIAAFKLDAICPRKEKKDYVDIAVLLQKFSFSQMADFYHEKFPMNDKRIVLTQIIDTEGLENSVEPVMLISLSPDQAIQQINQHVAGYSADQIKATSVQEEDRARKIAELIQKRSEGKSKGRGI